MYAQKKQYHSVKHMHPAITAPTIALSLVFFRWIASMTRLTEGRLPGMPGHALRGSDDIGQ